MKEYNAKKTREDRKIENYFSHVAEKQQHMAVEIIFQVADKEFWEKQKIQRKNVEYVYENILDYLQQYLPNFVVANAVVHYDEASPHMHVVNYIVVPIFLMLRDGDNWLKSVIGKSFLLNNLVILAIVYAATALPFTIYLLSGYFSTLAHDYEEAAYIDGAGYSTTMWKIIFPMAKPSIITVILFNFLSFWNEYIISMTLMSSANGPKTLPVGLLNLMQAQQSAAQYGIMYAGLVIVMLPTLILYICVQNKLTQGMTVGGLKG